MRKTKALFTLFLILVISIIPLLKVEAHSVDLDPKSLISFPMMISNGKGTITIKSTETGYNLYYQAVEVPNATYSQIETTRNNGKTELNGIKTEMDALDTECDNLKTIFDEAYEAYKAKLDSGETDAELETLKTAYETARTNYQNKGKEYNEKVKEYNDKTDEINGKIKELTPSYVETNWKKTEDRSFSVKLSEFSGNKAFAIWVKLVSSDGTISYDEGIYTMSGTKVEEIKVKSVSLDKTTISVTEGSSYTLTAIITPSDATNKLLTWSSSNENIAKVENGKVTGIAEGTATITVTTKDGNYKATCNVAVSKKVVTPSTTEDKKEENPPKEETPKSDNTIVKGKLPQTGSSSFIIISAIIVIAILGIVFLKKAKYMNF